MKAPSKQAKENRRSQFVEQAERPTRSFALEVLEYLLQNKKWWLIPVVIVLVLVGMLVMLAGTPAAPFLYPFF